MLNVLKLSRPEKLLQCKYCYWISNQIMNPILLSYIIQVHLEIHKEQAKGKMKKLSKSDINVLNGNEGESESESDSSSSSSDDESSDEEQTRDIKGT